MDLLLFVVALIGIGVLAAAFGRDSRDEVISKEHALAVLGMSWDGQPGGRARAPRVVVAPRFLSLRQRAAAVLYRLANWLHPGTSDPHPA
jgi:hypothetical protein